MATNQNFPDNLSARLQNRLHENALRKLPPQNNLIDFSSNDYIGFARSEAIFHDTLQLLADHNITANGATGSRLISGNHKLYEEAETLIANFHQTESALLFNSGYDANIGFFSSVPQRHDIILYDELCHASIRDGVRLSNAKSFKFGHNDLEELENLIERYHTERHGGSFSSEIYIATESVFSMDGDSPNFDQLIALSEKHQCRLVVDEAHALGVFGTSGEGLIQLLRLQDKVFARIMTFGKGLGVHGAAILGSSDLKSYLVNFARSFIYTTGLPPHSVAAIITAYSYLTGSSAIEQLRDNIAFFNQQKQLLGLKALFVHGKSAIASAIVPGNENVKAIAAKLQSQGFGVKAILSPTVPEGMERLRICLHSYNSETEITGALQSLHDLIRQ